MRARRVNKHTRPVRPLSSGHATSASKRGGRWIIRAISGAAAVKAYRCPGCNQLIPPSTPHLVAWPESSDLSFATGVEQRRHWHTACWERRR